MISTLTFLRRGIAAENPTVYKMTDEEYAKLREMAGEQVDLAREELEAAQAAAAANDEVDGMDEDGAESDSADSDEDPDIAKAKAAAARHGKDGSDDALAEYDLDNYDESAEIPDPTSRLFSNVSSLAVPAEEDPYLTLGGDEDEEDKDDIRVLPTDNLIVSARTEDDVSQVEVYIYERSEGNLYVRNDWLVPGMPLCMEWLDFGLGGEKGSYIAIGSYDPVIELWSLDVIDAVLPTVTLGTAVPKKTGKKKAKLPQKSDTSHVGAVLSLSWNAGARNLLASGSADMTAKLWDLNSPTAAVASYNHHTAPVQAIKFDPLRPPILLTGSHDQTAWVLDSRAPGSGRKWDLGSDVEAALWYGDKFLVSCEDGTVRCYDPRLTSSTPEWTLQAHDKPCSGLDVHPTVEGMLVTSSPDRTTKIWDIKEKPKMVASQDLGAGQIFCASFCPDFPGVAVGGTGGKVAVWDAEENVGVRKTFEGRIPVDESLAAAQAEGGERKRREVYVIEDGEGSEGSDSEDEEDEDEEGDDDDGSEMEED